MIHRGCGRDIRDGIFIETIERIVLKTILNAEQGFNGIIEIIYADE